MTSSVYADRVALTGSRGPVFGPLSFAVPPVGLAAVVGPEGSGRTALLLACTGRMRPSSGALRVLGHELPRHHRVVQRQTAIAHVDQIDALDEGLTVGEVLTERVGLLTPLWRPVPKPTTERVRAACSPVFGDVPLPEASTGVWELSALQLFSLRVTLAELARPRLLAVDNVDALADPADQRVAWANLARLAGQIAVLASVASLDEVPDAALPVPLDATPPSPAHAAAAGSHPYPAPRQES